LHACRSTLEDPRDFCLCICQLLDLLRSLHACGRLEVPLQELVSS